MNIFWTLDHDPNSITRASRSCVKETNPGNGGGVKVVSPHLDLLRSRNMLRKFSRRDRPMFAYLGEFGDIPEQRIPWSGSGLTGPTCHKIGWYCEQQTLSRSLL